MTPETIAQLNEHGLTVVFARDYKAMLLRLARLAQFERLIISMAEADQSGRVTDCVNIVRMMQEDSNPSSQPLDVLHIPAILTQVNRALHGVLDGDGEVCLDLLPTAVEAFIGILEAPHA